MLHVILIFKEVKVTETNKVNVTAVKLFKLRTNNEQKHISLIRKENLMHNKLELSPLFF